MILRAALSTMYSDLDEGKGKMIIITEKNGLESLEHY